MVWNERQLCCGGINDWCGRTELSAGLGGDRVRFPMGLAFSGVQIDVTGATKVVHDEFLAFVTPGKVF